MSRATLRNPWERYADKYWSATILFVFRILLEVLRTHVGIGSLKWTRDPARTSSRCSKLISVGMLYNWSAIWLPTWTVSFVASDIRHSLRKTLRKSTKTQTPLSLNTAPPLSGISSGRDSPVSHNCRLSQCDIVTLLAPSAKKYAKASPCCDCE